MAKEVDAKVIAAVADLTNTQLRRILRLAGYRPDALSSLAQQVRDRYEFGRITADDILAEWDSDQ